MIEHAKDSDCTINPETLCCETCGVCHDEECLECGGRGFHKPGCDLIAALFNQPQLQANLRTWRKRKNGGQWVN